MMRIKVATVQMNSLNNDYEGNVSRAEGHINEAVDKEAKVILLPELALVGYEYSNNIWNMAESLNGRTYAWLKGLCERHEVYIGTCIFEANEGDFYDTFILAGPEKDALWVHRKIEPAGYEANFFKGAGMNTNVFDTPIGRVGVAICFDSAKAHTISSLMRARPEILLIPYSCPDWPSSLSKKDGACWLEVFTNTPELYAKYLQVPVVSSNKVGRFVSPIPGMIGGKWDEDFIGRSSIIDRDGNLVSRIFEEEGVLAEEVELGKPSISAKTSLIPEGRWFLPYSTGIKLGTETSRKLGAIRYRWSKKRKNAYQTTLERVKTGGKG